MKGCYHVLPDLCEWLFQCYRLLDIPWLKIFGKFTGSYITWSGLGLLIACLLTWLVLPTCFHRLPCDRGRENAHDSEGARGKPTGAGGDQGGLVVGRAEAGKGAFLVKVGGEA